MSRGYSEDTLVEQPAVELFAGLGWQTLNAFHETFGAGGTVGREHAGEVVLTRHLVPALRKLTLRHMTELLNPAVGEWSRERRRPKLISGGLEVPKLGIESGGPEL